jgi:lysophosphatidate acyltransferase
MALLLSLVKPLAYISVPTLVLRSVSQSSPTARYYVRLGVYLTTLALVGAFSALLAAGMSLVGRRYDVNFVVARTFYFLAGQVTGMVVEVEGEEWLGTRPAVFMCNHQSVVDVLVLGR